MTNDLKADGWNEAEYQSRNEHTLHYVKSTVIVSHVDGDDREIIDYNNVKGMSYAVGFRDGAKWCRQFLDEPQPDPNPWIKCSERLPTKSDEIYEATLECSDGSRHVCSGVSIINRMLGTAWDHGCWERSVSAEDGDSVSGVRVIAWREYKPVPYEGEI